MKLDFKDIINTCINKPALVIAHGPSLDTIKKNLHSLKDRGFIIIDCNEWSQFHNVVPNFWVLANTSLTISSLKDIINQYSEQLKVVYADSVDSTKKEWIEQNIVADYLPYNQRNFKSIKKTIQEELQEYCKVDFHYDTGDTVAVHEIALAILLGCNPIYFIGIDLDYDLGYAKHDGNLTIPSQSFENTWQERRYKDLETLNNSAKNIGVEIINLNKKSFFQIMKIGEIK